MTRVALVISDVDGTLLTRDRILTEGAAGGSTPARHLAGAVEIILRGNAKA